MHRIEVAVINEPQVHMAPFLARMTQRGHELQDMESLVELFEKEASPELQASLAELPHGTIKRFDVYTVAIVGASRRFLAQIRTHQHADFVSGSLQYSDWSNEDKAAMFVVPYELFGNEDAKADYLNECFCAFDAYRRIAEKVGNDAAGFVLPNGMRNVLIIQANAQQWQYMINLRTCRRNSPETRYVMLKIWEALMALDSYMFSPMVVGPACQSDAGGCNESKFCCGNPVSKGFVRTPRALLKEDFPLLMEEQ